MADPKLLLVDDEAEFVNTLAERLQLRGIEAKTATTGEEALTLVEELSPDIVVLDIMMPGIGGLDMLKKIKADHPEIQVILLTGRGSTREGMEGISLGAFDYLMKPLSIEELIKKVNEALSRIGKPPIK